MDTGIIDEKLSKPSDYKVILCNLTNLNETIGGVRVSQEVTGWSIKALLDEVKREACVDWCQAAAE